MTVLITSAIIADRKGRYILDPGVTVSASGPVIDASASVSGRSFYLKGLLQATSGTGFVLGNGSLDDSNTTIRIEATGEIRSAGIGLKALDGGVDLLNLGQITTSSTALMLKGGSNTIENDGILRSSAGTLIQSSGPGDRIDNNEGSMRARLDVIVASGADFVFNNNASLQSLSGRGLIASGADAHITNNASLRAAGNAVTLSGSGAILTNTGTLSSDKATAVVLTGDEAILTNTTRISGSRYGIEASGDGLTLTNYATIRGNTALKVSGDDAIVTTKALLQGKVALVISGNDATVTNTNEIIGRSETAAAIQISATGETAFTNRSMVSASSGLAITGKSGSEHILNTGSILGDVRLGGGDDWFSSLKGKVSGRVEGGAGNDIYVVGIAVDLREAVNAGRDTVQSTISWTLGANFEVLELKGGKAIGGTGNAGDNEITGNIAANRLTGGRGDDHLTGGGGADLFIFSRNQGHDVIADFGIGEDRISIAKSAGITDFADLETHLSRDGGNSLITFDDGATIMIEDVRPAALEATDFLFA
ncbi:hypothetical protein [Rhizobium alvei]|uniref:Calcium-binding protein n=1 Tax=Rhizobium alvei TaxID=1132659 RepID=A0ABT8YHJ3_9HYPH|nr:hypothetical protein [Rhizobium alvei]MDO6962725.1 hypothetical protein [Rhizobium alvei]